MGFQEPLLDMKHGVPAANPNSLKAWLPSSLCHCEALALNLASSGLPALALMKALSMAFGVVREAALAGLLLFLLGVAWRLLKWQRPLPAAVNPVYFYIYEAAACHAIVFLHLSFLHNPLPVYVAFELLTIPLSLLFSSLLSRSRPSLADIPPALLILLGLCLSLSSPHVRGGGVALACCEAVSLLVQQWALHLARRDLSLTFQSEKLDALVVHAHTAPFQGLALMLAAALASLTQHCRPAERMAEFFRQFLPQEPQSFGLMGPVRLEHDVLASSGFVQVFSDSFRVQTFVYILLVVLSILFVALHSWKRFGGGLKVSYSTSRGWRMRLLWIIPKRFQRVVDDCVLQVGTPGTDCVLFMQAALLVRLAVTLFGSSSSFFGFNEELTALMGMVVCFAGGFWYTHLAYFRIEETFEEVDNTEELNVAPMEENKDHV